MSGKQIILKTEFTKVDPVKKVCYGWAYVSKSDDAVVVDHSGQTWGIDEVLKTAHQFITDCRVGGESHVYKGGATLVESLVLSKSVQEALGIDLGKEGWFVGFRIDDDALLDKIVKGELKMFSIGGIGEEEFLDA